MESWTILDGENLEADTTLEYHPRFVKSFRVRIRPNKQLKERALTRIEQFMRGERSKLLRDHTLAGCNGLRAFSVTGNVRIVYRVRPDNVVELLDIGSHNQVYNGYSRLARTA